MKFSEAIFVEVLLSLPRVPGDHLHKSVEDLKLSIRQVYVNP